MKLKIGIVSKPEHAKVHSRMLRALGHDVRVLGDRVREFPPSLDLVVCRCESISHQASWDTADLSRQGKKVIWEDGVANIVKAVEDYQRELTEQMQLKEEERNMNIAGSYEGLGLKSPPETAERKLSAAVRALGVFSPRVSISEEMIVRLYDLGVVENVLAARSALANVQTIAPKTWPSRFDAMRRSGNYSVYTLWKLSDNKKVKTPYEMLAVRTFSTSTLERIAFILGLTTVEPLEGRTWPPYTSLRKSDADTAPVVAVDDPVSVQQPGPDEAIHTADELKVETATELCSPFEQVAEANTPPVALPPSPAVVETTSIEIKPLPRVRSHKADLKELVSMFKEACREANIQAMTLELRDGEVHVANIEQVVVRRFASLDDIE